MIKINLLKNHPDAIPELAHIWHEILGTWGVTGSLLITLSITKRFSARNRYPHYT